MSTYYCAICQKHHQGPALSFGPAAPFAYEQIPPSERTARAELTSDVCLIDQEHFYILGNIELPIRDRAERFAWSVWVSLSKANMKRTAQLWESPGRESEPPYFGWLDTELRLYPSTLGLRTRVHTRPVGTRPLIELEPTDHPLAIEQREGIPWSRVITINQELLHATQ